MTFVTFQIACTCRWALPRRTDPSGKRSNFENLGGQVTEGASGEASQEENGPRSSHPARLIEPSRLRGEATGLGEIGPLVGGGEVYPHRMSEYKHRKSLGKAVRARGYSSAKSVEIKLSATSAAKLLAVLALPTAEGQVISILVDKDSLAASVLWEQR